MLDFFKIKTKMKTKYTMEVYPEFIVKNSKDLMIRGGSFYAIWDEEKELWTRNEDKVQYFIDKEIDKYMREAPVNGMALAPKYMSEFSSRMWSEWKQYCKSLPDNYHELDKKILFSNDEINKKDYATMRLDYPLQRGKLEAYNELMNVLYDKEERKKIEWAIGAIISGYSKRIQKFLVFYGGPGTGKSTVLNIIGDMFKGYCASFDSKSLASNNSFAMEVFKNNPVVAIQHDGDLSKIEDNHLINSIVSHESMIMNEKFKSQYEIKLMSFLLMGTNKPVKITDAKSGILRRLIDVSPTGRLIPEDRYHELMSQIKFEYGAIAYHCLKLFEKMTYKYYSDYRSIRMVSTTNNFYNFIEDNLDYFLYDNPEYVTLNAAWLRYKTYCEDSNIKFPFEKRIFRYELLEYFKEFKDEYDGKRMVYIGFKKNKFNIKEMECNYTEESWLKLSKKKSLLDKVLEDYPAQYATDNGIPKSSWKNVKTTLKDIDTSKLHYVKVPQNLIVIDFDIKNEKGEKDYKENIKLASSWPRTYAETSKSGGGIHLHYYYDGDVQQLSRLYDTNIEIKVYTGDSALRRQVVKCNDEEIATINSGLPLKEVKNNDMISEKNIKSEKALRELIKKNLRKEIHSNTTQSINFIKQILDDAYNSGLKYDVTDMFSAIQAFANNSTHQASNCIKMVSKMKFKSEEPNESFDDDSKPIGFFDVEVFPNLFILCYKKLGEENKVISLINPKAEEVESVINSFRLIGYNNRKYDNHICYAAMMGYRPDQLYKLSQRIIDKQDKNAFFGEAYNLSYTDIYDFASNANKKSLKKFEIELGIHHQECPYRWDEPVPEDKWMEVADYCCNDVLATEAVWNTDGIQSDWIAREILSDWSGLSKNDTTNNHTIKIVVGNDKNPQSQFIYTDLSTIYPGYEYNPYGIDPSRYNEGSKIVNAKSIYRGEDPSEGGRVFATPGIYHNVALLDVASMHPSSIINLKIFGEVYTKRYENIKMARLHIKHGDFEKAKEILPQKLHKYLTDKKNAKKLSNALKTALNSAYGLTSATFPNKFKDPRNIDNIVAKYGSLFMINLQFEIQQRGFTVVHIKTDSIKIANATREIIDFVFDYGKQYGFNFEHEATYERICLVNDAVYIAKYLNAEECNNLYGYVPEENLSHQNEWTATGTQFQVPYTFKELFSKEKIEFKDLCETKSVTSAMYLDFNEFNEDNHDYRFIGRVGSFVPVLEGFGGGKLLRQATDKDGNIKYDSVSGCKDYRWLDAEMCKSLDKDAIDMSYYQNEIDKAVKAIEQFGSFEEFVA